MRRKDRAMAKIKIPATTTIWMILRRSGSMLFMVRSLLLRLLVDLVLARPDAVPHVSVGLDVLQVVVVHDPQVALAERLGDRLGDLRLREDDLGPVLALEGLHFL